MKRSELVNFLKDVLGACGEGITIDTICLTKTQVTTRNSDSEHRLLV